MTPRGAATYRGSLCCRGHDDGRGRSLRYRKNRACVACNALWNSVDRQPEPTRKWGMAPVYIELRAMGWTLQEIATFFKLKSRNAIHAAIKRHQEHRR